MNLVKAQEARRVLDRLVGYTISPLLWKKVAYGLSAGRVQSVAVRLVVEREHERIKFKKSAYWGLSANLEKNQTQFESRLLSYQNQRIATGKDFDGTTGKLTAGKDVLLLDEAKAKNILNEVQKHQWTVTDVEEKPVFRKPAPPFITSTLQQEANRKLGLGARETMQVAQKLYEQGFITYMRTDSTFLSEEAIKAARSCIQYKYGKEYLTEQPRNYSGKKVKGAQEAHEAIRPAGTQFIDPDETGLDGAQFRLYDLIWKRTVASQMVDARQKQVSTKISVADAIFTASGMTIEFPGFLRAYVEGSDDPEAELSEREVRLPQLKIRDSINCKKLDATSHETKPPARFTEASLVQTMEKEGIGRPSTYASVISTIIDRGYVKKHGTALVPTFTAMVVSKLLSQHLPKYVDLGFTSSMENSLDNIADGDLDWEKYLSQIYHGPQGLRATVESQEEKINPDEARTIKLEGMDQYTFHVGRYGAYLTTKRGADDVSASLPENESPADLTPEIAEKLIDQKINGADSLGKDPKTGLPIYVLNGRFGPYVQLGDVSEENDKPKRASLPSGMTPEMVTLPVAIDLLALPKTLGLHPETQKEIKAGIGRFGPFIVHDGDYRSIPKGLSIFAVDLPTALEIFKTPKKGRGKNSTPLRELGQHPLMEENMQVMNGPYGPYIKCAKVNVSLPEGVTVEALTVEQAIQLVTEKAGNKIKSKGGKKSAAGKSAVKKVSAKLKDKGETVEKEVKVKVVPTKAAKGSGFKSKDIKSATTAADKAKVLGVKKVITRKR